jgi:hypothetical protein
MYYSGSLFTQCDAAKLLANTERVWGTFPEHVPYEAKMFKKFVLVSHSVTEFVIHSHRICM